jgi:SAM-dependent methyltransferase
MDALTPEMEALKARLRATWMAGDFGQIAKYSEAWADDFISGLPIKAGMKALDVACGTGNVSLALARRGADVTGVDIAPNLLEQARARADAEGLKIQFDEGDAEQLPYGDTSFDVVTSMFGAMFAPRPERAAAELIRVCRPGGRVLMGNWTPEGFTGKMFKLTSTYAPPPPGMQPPVLWGNEATVRERLRDGVTDLKLTRRPVVIAFPFDEADVVEYFRRYFGPSQRTFDALDPERQADLRRDLEALWKEHNRATDGTTRVESEYLEVMALRG